MSSLASSARPNPAPLRTMQASIPTRKPPPVPPPSLPLSRSQQLALAVAAEEAKMNDSMYSSQKRSNPSSQVSSVTDSHFSEAGNGSADVIWQGKGASFFDKGLPSPGIQSANHTSNEDSHGEFADADEGFDSDELRSLGDNTTFTTLSTSGSATKRSALPSPKSKKDLPPIAVPARPRRKAPRPAQPLSMDDEFVDEDDTHSNDDDDEDLEGGTTYGHASRASIGSSIWAGRGKKKNYNVNEGIPAMPSPDLSMYNNSSSNPMNSTQDSQFNDLRKQRASVAETSSLYSQGGATEWGDDAAHQAILERTPPLDKLRLLGKTDQASSRLGEDEFEMMDTQSIYEGRNSISASSSSAAASSAITSPTFAPYTAEPERRLPDGTLVPKMPPLPPHHYSPDPSARPGSGNPQKRGKKGRQNRSPILSYADGEEEEARLVQERELRESGGLGGLQTTATGMGPRLKKNSPAPWEMEDDGDSNGNGSLHGRDSTSNRNGDGHFGGGGLASRPSMDNLLAAGIKHPSSWARQSMEQFRNRSVSNGSNGQQNSMPFNQHGSLASSKSTTAFPPGASPLGGMQASSPLADTSNETRPSAFQSTDVLYSEDIPSRRSRTKSISGSAAGVLKGLGLASSAAPAKKASSSRLAKAFQRSNKVVPPNGTMPNESARKQSLTLSKGISSEDYAHLPVSPTLNQNSNLTVANGPNGSSPYMSHSSANSHSSLSHRSEGSPASPNFPPSASSAPPMPTRSTSVTGKSITPVNVSNEKRSASGTAAVPNSSADGHSLTGSSSSHNLQQRLNGGLHRAEMMDMIMASNAKVRDQAFVTDLQAHNPTGSSLGTSSTSTETTADTSAPHTPSLHVQRVSSGNNNAVNFGENFNTSPKPPIQYKNPYGSSGVGVERNFSPSSNNTAQQPQSFKSHQNQVRTKASNAPAPVEGEPRSNGSAGSRSQESQRSQPSLASQPVSGVEVSNDVQFDRSHEKMNSTGQLGKMTKMPSVGSHDGVPYKLISLEEARLQQQRANQTAPRFEEAGIGMTASHSDKSLGLNESVYVIPPPERERILKGKKSVGFLRRFGKDKTENSNNSDNLAPLPSFGPSPHLPAQQNDSPFSSSKLSTGIQTPPTLSVRPMSSMFTGFAPGLIDVLAVTDEGEEENEKGKENGFLSPMDSVQRTLAPHSPAITIASVDSATSGADYYDAPDGVPSDANILSHSTGSNNATLRAPNSTNGPSFSPTSPHLNQLSSRPSTDSARSDNSSALGLVNGFPNLPTTGHGATAASLTSKATLSATAANGSPSLAGGKAMGNSTNQDGISSLASATRSRALEIEAQMSELQAELVKLRIFAIDSGLAKPNPLSISASALPDLATSNVNSTSEIETDPSKVNSIDNQVDDEQDIAQQEDALLVPIGPCTHCGCHCAEQKRLQSLNELAILKGISVLDRGRALKPLAGQNGSKFGGYLDR